MNLDNPYEERDFSKLSYEELKALKAKRKENLSANNEKLRDVKMSKWMRTTDREKYMDFEESVRVVQAVQKENKDLLRFVR